MTLSRTLLVAALGLSLAACDSSTGPESESDAAPVLSNVATDVITATYADLAAEAADLVTAVGAFADDRSAGRLEAARQQWRDTRAPWELSGWWCELCLDHPCAGEALAEQKRLATELEQKLAPEQRDTRVSPQHPNASKTLVHAYRTPTTSGPRAD